MLVNVDGQICELVKADAKGGNYHRRVPRKNGKGFNYYYTPEDYERSKQAHLDGPATRSARLAKAVLGTVEGAGKKGCSIKNLREMAKKEGKEHVAKAIKGCLEKGDLSYKKGMLYRKAMKEAALELKQKPKEAPKDEQKDEKQPEKPKRKAMRDEPQKKPLKKAEVRLYLDELQKAKGPIGRGKRGGKIYGYDSKGKPIYKPSEVPSKGGKKKPSKPEAQLSLFGQPKLKPKPAQKEAQPAASEVVEAEKPKLTPLAQKMVRVRDLMEMDYPGATDDQIQDLYRKMQDAQAGRPGSDIDAAIAEAEALLAKKPEPEAEHVAEQPKETPATVELEQQKHEPTAWAKRMREELKEKNRESGIRHLAREGFADAQEQLREIEAAKKAPTPMTPEEEAEIKATWEGLPRSGKGWKLITKPYAKQKLKRFVDETIAKIDKLPPGSQVRVTAVDGEVTDWRVLGDGKVTLKGLAQETPMPTYVALPEWGGAVFAQVEVKPAPAQAGQDAKAEPAAEHDTAEQQAAAALPEIPPKPEAPPRIAKKDFGREMRRRAQEGLTPRGNSYAVKDEIKEVGGIWDRYDRRWLLPSQEAVDYIQARMAHAEVERNDVAVKAASEGRVVSGRTWDVREEIKRAGGKWHGATKQWIMPDKESAVTLQELVDNTTTGTRGSSGGPATARQIEVASSMMQKVGREAWARTEFGKQGYNIPRARAMLKDLNMLQMSDLIAIMKGDK